MIGVFDSGIGGLSILRALRAELPDERFIYVADSGHAPYGERDAAHVRSRARAITRFLVAQGAHALVVACNTATAAAIHLLREEFAHLPIIGVEPALKPAVALSPGGCIGVMATRGTLHSDKFGVLLDSLQGQARFVLQACDGLALAIERSAHGSAASASHLTDVATQHVRALQAACPAGHTLSVVVLGCTHYPLVSDLLASLFEPKVTLLDPGQAVARHTRHRLAGLSASALQGEALRLLCTGETTALQAAAQRWISPQAQAHSLQID